MSLSEKEKRKIRKAAIKHGIRYGTLIKRMSYGLSLDEALERDIRRNEPDFTLHFKVARMAWS